MKEKAKYFKGLFIFLFVAGMFFTNGFRSSASSYDTTAPIIKTARVLQSEIYAPNTLQIELSDIIEDGSGIRHISLILTNENNQTIGTTIFIGDTPLFTGNKYIFNLQIPDEVHSGEYHLSHIYLYDNKGNYRPYAYCEKMSEGTYKLGMKGTMSGTQEEVWLKNTCIAYGTVKIHGDTFDESTSISNPNIGTLINKMDDGGIIKIYATGNNTIIPKSAFDALKGTNKKINVSVSDGVKWIFDGKDITEATKAIDCKVNISTVQDESYGTTDKLMKITFANNGVLPGKAKIKLKSDYLSKLYKVGNILNLYYLDGQKLTLEDDNVKTVKSGNDSWCEYEITHNSTFLLSKGKLKYQKPFVKLNAKSTTMQAGKSSSALKIIDKLSTDSVKSWKSSKPKVVSVNSKGKLKAKKTGTSTITVTLESGAKATCKVNVQKAVVKTKSISISKSKVELTKGKTHTIAYTRNPVTANDKVTFKSSKPKVATVNSKGKITAKRKGKATITIKAGKKSKKVTVIVK